MPAELEASPVLSRHRRGDGDPAMTGSPAPRVRSRGWSHAMAATRLGLIVTAMVMLAVGVGLAALAGHARRAAPIRPPTISLPEGFAPVAHYSRLLRDYVFDGSSLPAGWTAGRDDNHGFGATVFQASQVAMTGSSVALTASNHPSEGWPYQSGWISTEGSFAMDHGLIDFRAKMPAGAGLWSGLWLDQPDHSDPWGELDVQEMLLGNTNTVYGSLHSWAPAPEWSELQTDTLSVDAAQAFHDYQVIWQPGLITWAVDGVAYAQYTKAQALAAGHPWPFDDGKGFYLIADLAVAGSWEWGGGTTAATVFPATMQLQSVRVWD